jgi:hypothetical protein
MNHKTHSYLMVGLLAVGAVLFFSGGVGGGALFLLWPLLCMGSMFAMIWFMGGWAAARPSTPTTTARRTPTTRSRSACASRRTGAGPAGPAPSVP